jgi:CRISPR-associated protein Cas5 subtype I-B
MKGIVFKLTGQYGHFKQPQTNNNPCTFAYMHKVAIIGFLGAVTGIERELMAVLYPQLCEDLICSIKLLTPIVKEPHAFTKRIVIEEFFYGQGRRFCEYLKDPGYEITLALKGERSKQQFEDFCHNIKNDLAVYPTSFGVVNCPAYFEFIKDVEVSNELNGPFETDSIISDTHVLADNDFVSERVPTNEPQNMLHADHVLTVCVQGTTVSTSGPYRKVDGKSVWFM